MMKLFELYIILLFITSSVFAQQPEFETFQPVQLGQSYNPAPTYNSSPLNNINQYNSALQSKNASQMIQYSPKINNEDILNELRNESDYYSPSAENKFNQFSPQMRMEREMVHALKEADYNSSAVTEMEYYNSPEYKKDLPNYTKAKETINKMLSGEKPLSIKDAYFLSESAYGNLQLSYDEYNNIIKENARFIKQWLKENGYNLKDPEALHLGIQKFLSDTLFISNNAIDQLQPINQKKGHSPYYYDYIDYDSKEDRRNYFVTKTLATGTGQCHTLPTTYLILAEALGVQAYLSYNPIHSFIRYKNNKGIMVNYETTVDRFMPDQFYLETLPVMAKAKRNKIFINSLNKKQVVASVLLDLAVNFTQEHWLSDKKFISECMTTASIYFPNQNYINTAGDYLNKRLYADAFNKKVREKGIRDLNEIEKYPDVLEAYNNFHAYMEKVSSLGVQDFPEGDYIKMMEYYDKKGKLQTAKKIDAKSRKNLFFNN